MKLLDKLVLLDLLPMFGFSIALFTSLYFAAGPMLEAVKNLSSGVPMLIVVRLLILNIPVVLALTLPMAVVLAVLNGYGRISGDSESVAILAAGVPFARAAAPAVLFGLVTSLLGYGVSDYLAIAANQQITELKMTALKQIQTDTPIQIPLIKKDNLTYSILVGKATQADNGVLENVTVTFYNEHMQPTEIVYAKRAKWAEDQNWVLYGAGGNLLGQTEEYIFNSQLSVDFHATPKTLVLLNTDPSTLSFAQLEVQAMALRAGGFFTDARKSELARWRIVALPFASLVFAIIGSPLGLRPQRTSQAAGWGLAVLIIFGYYVLYMVTGSMSDGGYIPPIAAAFAPDIVGLIIGGVLVARAST